MIDPAAVEDQWSLIASAIDAAVARLGERDRRSILLRYFNGKSTRDVAAALNVSEQAATKRLSRGIEKLRKLLAARGLLVTTAALTATLASRTVEAAPVSLHQAIAPLMAGHAGAGSSIAQSIARKTASTAARFPLAIAASLAIALTSSFAGWLLLANQGSHFAAAQTAPVENQPVRVALPASSPTTAPLAGAWPIFLPGTITGSPTLVDLDGDGKREIVVPYMGMIPNTSGGGGTPAGGREPDFAARVAAFHLDGTPVAGWPVTIMSAQNHQAAQPSEYPNWWLSTPAVIDASAGNPAVVVIGHPGGPNKIDRGTSIIRGDGKQIKLPTQLSSPDPGSTLVLVDLDGSGTNVILGAATVSSIDGHSPRAWMGKKLPAGFSASAGDVDGDGHPETFLVTQRRGTSNASVVAYDHTGQPRAGWPQKIGGKSFAAPSLGNVFGDEKLEVIVPDFHNHLLAWTWDGQPFGSTFREAEGRAYSGKQDGLTPAQLEQEKCTSIFKDDIDCAGPAALADLDGDGLAEIIVVDQKTRTLRAWHGDGSGFGGAADGVIAHLGEGDLFGVSVLGPDEAGGVDFFAGNWWVHRDKDGLTDIREMIARTVPSQKEGTAGDVPASVDTTCQDTVCDLAGDGHADVLIGTTDGRVIIYHTGLKYSAKLAQWPMLGHDVKRSGCWRPQS